VNLDSPDLRLKHTEGYVKHVTIGGIVFLLLCVGGTRAGAQGVASSFDQLSVLVKPGDKISVVDVTGRETDGRIGTLSRDALTLVTEAGPRVLAEADVGKIRQRRGDPLRNGAIIGAAAGGSFGLTMLWLVESGRFGDGGGVQPGSVVTGLMYFTGIGAAIGVGMDALIARRQVIYQKPAGGSKVSVSPLFGHGRRGAAVSIKF
jgi:hypothetical protein